MHGRGLALPYLTARPRQPGEQNIGANMLLAKGSAKECIALLKCAADMLEHVVIRRDKQDYERFQSLGAPDGPTMGALLMTNTKR